MKALGKLREIPAFAYAVCMTGIKPYSGKPGTVSNKGGFLL